MEQTSRLLQGLGISSSPNSAYAGYALIIHNAPRNINKNLCVQGQNYPPERRCTAEKKVV
jgi:hypothetical protein